MTRKRLFFTILVVSALTLELELLQTRILSVVLWHHFVYITITMALLGFAASGTALNVIPALRQWREENFYAFCLVGFSVTSFISTRLGVNPRLDIFRPTPDLPVMLALVGIYTLFMLPYFFAGLTIAGSFVRFPDNSGVLYFANLLGSGVGCLSFVLMIGLLGAPKMIILTSLISLLLIPPFLGHKKAVQCILSLWIFFLTVGLFFPETVTFLKILPGGSKQFWTMFGRDTVHEYSRWNPISRIDVVSHSRFPQGKHILMDGDAEAKLYTRDAVRETSKGEFADRRAAFHVLHREPQKTLVIGAGGGFEVILADLMGSKEIHAVEINPTTADMASRVYGSHLNGIFSQPHVKLFVEDGRSFVRRAKSSYDIIMMYATDSLLALSSGAYVLLDNYLYTEEAFEDYLERLSEEGVIEIGRWFYRTRPRESLRIFTTALEALRKKAFPDPLSCVVVLRPGNQPFWVDVLIKKSPFTAEELGRLRNFSRLTGSEMIYSYELLHDEAPEPSEASFLEFARHFSRGEEGYYYENYPFRVRPVTDDSPFFYQYQKTIQGLPQWRSPYYDNIRGGWHVFVLTFLLIHAGILTLAFVILPLVMLRGGMGGLGRCLSTFVFFFSIGLAFMFVEMVLIQRCVLFLGHPIYSMALVIPAILIFAGLGSLSSQLVQKDMKGWILKIAIVLSVFLLMLSLIIAPASKRLLSEPLLIRVIAVLTATAPLGYLMGFPFPLALRILRREAQTLIPWAWAINGSASVLASILAVMVAMLSGFTTVLYVAVSFYALAAISGPRLDRRFGEG